MIIMPIVIDFPMPSFKIAFVSTPYPNHLLFSEHPEFSNGKEL